TTHSYNTSNRLFINPQVTAELKYLNIFPTCEINKIVSKETQKKIFRFETYLSIDNPVSANKSGILGLLDEYSAYQTGTTFGLQAAEKLFFEGKIDEAEIQYQKACASYFANYEFSLFIAWYLEYAKQYKPEIYKETMANKSVRLAFTLNEKMFNNTILKLKSLATKNSKFTSDLEYYEKEYAEYTKSLLEKHSKTIDGFRIQGVDLENYSAYQNKK
ncbi:MAG: hypothetical protein ACK452_03855, partial [Bacteroidota bacterium]